MAATTSSEKNDLLAELNAAATTASMSDRGKSRKVLLVESDLPSLIPSRSLLKVRSVKFTELRMGDIICVRVGSDFVVRRFVKTKITRENTLLLSAREGSDKKDPIPQSSLLGKVEEAESAGETYDPLKKEGLVQRLMGKITEYGTHRPFGVFGSRS